MKPFSYLSIILATSLMGYFFIIGLPKIASISEIGQKKLPVQMNLEKDLPENKTLPVSVSTDKRDACNALMSEKTFASGSEADTFLDNCLKNEAPRVQQNTTESTVDNQAVDANTLETNTIRLTKEELLVKCNDFMSRARFESKEAEDAFLKNCLAGK